MPGIMEEGEHSPALLSFQKLPVGGDLHIKGQLDIHELLVLLQQPGHVLLGLLQGILQPFQLAPGILEGILPTLLSFSNGSLKIGTLGRERKTNLYCGSFERVILSMVFLVCSFDFLFLKTRFFCITALGVLEVRLVDQAGFELTEIYIPLPPKC